MSAVTVGLGTEGLVWSDGSNAVNVVISCRGNVTILKVGMQLLDY